MQTALMITAALTRWIARLLGTAIVLVFFAFLFGEGPPRLADMNPRLWLMFLSIAVEIIGLAAAWRWPQAGGAAALFAALLIGVAEPRLARTFLVGGAAGVALLHLVSGRFLAGKTVPAIPGGAWLLVPPLVLALLAANEILMIQPLFMPRIDPSPFAGEWRADGIRVEIAPDGKLAGEIEGQPITGGRLGPNRTWFGRLMHWRTEYMLRGLLPGGKMFTAPLDRQGEALNGGIFVPGTRSRRLRLERVATK